MLVVNATREAERLEAGVAVADDLTPDIVCHLLHDCASFGINGQARAAEVVTDDAVGFAALDHVGGDIALVGVNETGNHITVAVEFGDGVELVLVEEALLEYAVDLFTDTAVLPINHVIEGYVAGEFGLQQVAELVVAVGGGRATVGLAVQFAVGGVGVAVAAPCQQAVLCVIRAAIAVKSAVIYSLSEADTKTLIPHLFNTLSITTNATITRAYHNIRPPAWEVSSAKRESSAQYLTETPPSNTKSIVAINTHPHFVSLTETCKVGSLAACRRANHKLGINNTAPSITTKIPIAIIALIS